MVFVLVELLQCFDLDKNENDGWIFSLSADSLSWKDARQSCGVSGKRFAVLDTPEKVLTASKM